MLQNSFWEEGTKRQWLFCANDNSPLDQLQEKVNIENILYSAGDEPINLGIKRINGRIYSSNYVGLCKLKGIDGKNLLTTDGKEVVLKIEPRFNITIVDMLNMLRDDDEFERYLAPQTTRIGDAQKEVEDVQCNELFYFFDKEDPIYVKDYVALNSSIITASVFLSMLKGLCRKPLMGKMLCQEENLVGKVKGKILFSKNIKENTLRGRDDRIYCRYLQYSEDIIENQVLKAALHKAEQFLDRYFASVSGNRNSLKEMASYCRNALSHISHIKITQQDISKIKTTGCYIHYKPVINVAKMVLNEITLEANGQSKLTSYIVPYAISMEKLFEMYVRAYLKGAGIKSYLSTEKEIRLLQYDYKAKVLDKNGGSYSDYISGNIKPDIVLYNPETEKYTVFDVKYKNSSNKKFARNDRLQILAYSLMYDCDNVGIIFPHTTVSKNMYYEKNEIKSAEIRQRFYNELEFSLDTEFTYQLHSKTDDTSVSVLQYISDLTK